MQGGIGQGIRGRAAGVAGDLPGDPGESPEALPPG